MATHLILLIHMVVNVLAAPTQPVPLMNQLSALNPWYPELMESVCNDVTIKACFNRDGYMFRYSVFDPITRFCVCAPSPSEFMVSSSQTYRPESSLTVL